MTKIVYLGRLSDLTGVSEEEIEIPENIETANALRRWLDVRFEADGALLDETIRIAIDHEISLDTAVLSGAKEIALMPPVGGG